MEILILLLVAISLSMDAFSLSLAYGTLNLRKREIWQLSLIVGMFHFFMPLIGMKLGAAILKILPVHPDVIIFIVLLFIGIQMIIESKKDDTIDKKMNLLESILFGFAVSIDSFSIGIGILGITTHFLLASILFSMSSFFFTYTGLLLGKKCHHYLGNIATRLGGIGLIIIGIICVL